MDNEPLPRHWYPANSPKITVPLFSDGGQNVRRKAVNLGFEQSPYHVVSGGDATLCYSEKKCREAVRQFVYLAPDCFVVYDRVTSVEPDQQKVWLWHTQNEPSALAPNSSRPATAKAPWPSGRSCPSPPSMRSSAITARNSGTQWPQLGNLRPGKSFRQTG